MKYYSKTGEIPIKCFKNNSCKNLTSFPYLIIFVSHLQIHKPVECHQGCKNNRAI